MKAKLTVTYVYEYEIKPEYYGELQTDEERMNLDIETYTNDPASLDMLDAKSMTIKGELIDD